MLVEVEVAVAVVELTVWATSVAIARDVTESTAGSALPKKGEIAGGRSDYKEVNKLVEKTISQRTRHTP